MNYLYDKNEDGVYNHSPIFYPQEKDLEAGSSCLLCGEFHGNPFPDALFQPSEASK